MTVKALQFVLAAAQQMKQQSDCGPRLVRPAMLAVHVVRQENRLHFFGFIVVIEKLSQAAGEKRNELRDFCARNSPKPFAHPEQVTPPCHRCSVKFWRWLHKKRLQIACQLLQLIVDLNEAYGVFDRNLSELR